MVRNSRYGTSIEIYIDQNKDIECSASDGCRNCARKRVRPPASGPGPQEVEDMRISKDRPWDLHRV